MYNLIAKSNPIQSIREHTDNVLEDLDYLLELYGNCFTEKEVDAIKICCEYHDYGKSIYIFQQNIGNRHTLDGLKPSIQKSIIDFYTTISKLNNIPHGYMSPAFLNKRELINKYGKDTANNIVKAIYFHHNRKSNCTKDDLISILNNDIKIRFSNIYLQSGYLSTVAKKYNILDMDNYDDIWCEFAILKGILNRCDYHASSGEKENIEIPPLLNGKNISNYVEETILSKYGQLRNVQSFMLENNDKNLVIVASTGIGKTEASLLWSYGQKTFYTLPLKVSINAIYERVKNEYGYGDKLMLMHSDAISYLLDEDNDKYKHIKSFSYPLTVCTIDQLFSFVYKYSGCEQILATLKYSKLIIDEIQAYSPQLVAKIIYGLKLITQVGGKFAIITATMPPIFEYYLKKQKIDYLKPNKSFLSDKIRHFISFKEEELDYVLIAEQGKYKKVLVICNTIKKAQEVYNNISDCCDTYLLHSHFIRKDRQLLEDSIMNFSCSNKNGVWVATQLVEASLDIDFDILFTEMAAADSILQRMGRCYRKREYKENYPNVYIYNTGNGRGYIYDEEIFDRSVMFLNQYNDDFFNEEQKQNYINVVYDENELKRSNFSKEIRNEIDNCSGAIMGLYTKEESMRNLRNISAINVIPEEVYSFYNQNSKIDDCCNIIKNKHCSLKEKIKAEKFLNSLTISINKFSNKAKLADLKPISDNSFIKIYRIQSSYSFDETLLKGEGLTDNLYVDKML